jgi:hypothetical protein
MLLRSTLSLVSLSLALVSARATTITTYSSYTNWSQATASGFQTITFAGDAPSGGVQNYNGPTGLTQDGVEFIGYNSSGTSDLQVIDTSAFSYYDWGTGDAPIQSLNRPNASSPLPYINIVLPANISSLGLNLFTASPEALNFTITVAGNQYSVPTYSQPTLAFWGITSTSAISSIQLTLAGTTYNGGSSELLANFAFGDVMAAPEASTYLMIGSGLIGLVLLRKRLAMHK